MFRKGPPYNGPLGALRAVPDASGVFRQALPAGSVDLVK